MSVWQTGRRTLAGQGAFAREVNQSERQFDDLLSLIQAADVVQGDLESRFLQQPEPFFVGETPLEQHQ